MLKYLESMYLHQATALCFYGKGADQVSVYLKRGPDYLSTACISLAEFEHMFGKFFRINQFNYRAKLPGQHFKNKHTKKWLGGAVTYTHTPIGYKQFVCAVSVARPNKMPKPMVKDGPILRNVDTKPFEEAEEQFVSELTKLFHSLSAKNLAPFHEFEIRVHPLTNGESLAEYFGFVNIDMWNQVSTEEIYAVASIGQKCCPFSIDKITLKPHYHSLKHLDSW
ncbi:hypothetical protein AAFX24_28050 [Vibrio mediterranei]|uniref:hypothetical protein n=1 Tax=Vibrio mediterranei TaxID=689 RepID=UPI0038CE7A21